MKQYIALLLAIVIQVTPIIAQDLDNTKIITISSALLQQKREVRIHLPQDYNAALTYPVIYITDGSTSNFEVAKHYVESLSHPDYNIIPQSIVVGIVHPEGQRNRDLNVFESESSKQFMSFLFQEVVPMIDNSYSTSGFNAMIGHSNGAEYNHFILLNEDNPFRAFISISTSFNTDVSERLGHFFKSYKGKQLYYFVANGLFDAESRIEAGDAFESLAETVPNEDIAFTKKDYKRAGHINLVPYSMLDGLQFIFKDYNNIKAYKDIVDYGDNYLADLKENYGVEGRYSLEDLDGFMEDIFQKKDKVQYLNLLSFIETHKLWFGGPLDAVNIANHFFFMDMMPETIMYWNKAVDAFDTVEERVFFYNREKAIAAFTRENKLEEAIDFLERARTQLSDQYKLFIDYDIAKLSIENKVLLNKGKKALENCKANYRDNKTFSKADLDILRSRI